MTITKADTALDMVRDAKIVAIDSETTGVNWLKACPIGWAIAAEGHSVYVPVRHGGGGNLHDPTGMHVMDSASGTYRQHKFEARLNEELRKRGRDLTLAGHNMKFDYHMAKNVGVDFGLNQVVCTMNNEALLDEYAHSYTLDAVAKKYGGTPKQSQPMYDHLSRLFGVPAKKDSMAHFWKTSGSDPMVVEYAEADARATLEVALKQTRKIWEEELQQIWHLENTLIHVLVAMERRGVKLDVEYLHSLPDLLVQYQDEALAKLPHGFNVRSPKQVKEWVSRYNTNWPVTAKGNPSFTKDYLATFPEGQIINDVREWANLLSSFVQPLIAEHMYNGRVHTSFNQNRTDAGGTLSGRLSCFAPNLMGVPKHNKRVARVLRRAFIPDDGYKLYEADYSQIEPRMYAHYSRDPVLVEGYKSGLDTHTLTAQMLNKDRATVAKRMNMGMFTGMFPKTFAVHMGVSLKQAQQWWNEWHDAYAGIRPFQEQCKSEIVRNGHVRTLLGRKGRLESHRYAYRATSKIIQGSVADLLKFKMVEAETFSGKIELLLSIHDSLVFQAVDYPEGAEDAKGLVEMMAYTAGDPLGISVPCIVDVESGVNWAEASGL